MQQNIHLSLGLPHHPPRNSFSLSFKMADMTRKDRPFLAMAAILERSGERGCVLYLTFFPTSLTATFLLRSIVLLLFPFHP